MQIFDKDNRAFTDDVLNEHIESALTIDKPTGPAFKLAYHAFKRIYRPLIRGADNIPDKPCLFVGNHSLFALDGFILGPIMYYDLDRFVRGMGDRFLFTNPKSRKILESQGAVVGHPDVCTALMEQGNDLLVFPGGAHEAVKSADQLYELQWKERYGFIKLAAAHGYTIQPFAMVGPDEFYDHLIEGDELLNTPLGTVLKRLGLVTEQTRSDVMPPIPIGALGSLIPKPQRCFVEFGEPLDLSDCQGKRLTKKRLKDLRDTVAEEIDESLRELLLLREQRRSEDGLLRRILTL